MREADRRDFSAFLGEFQAETDRGAALVGAALLDHKLKETLRAFMVEGKVSEGLLEGGSAPLGTFSSRIKMSFALGLIDNHERHECEIIRKVRNEFAHRVHGTTFDQAEIRSLCSALQSGLPGGGVAFRGRPRDVFVNAVILVALGITYRADFVARERRVTHSWPN